MPRPPRFQSERAQRIAVAAFTLTLLLVSLGLAWAFTLSHQLTWSVQVAPATVGSLRLAVPVDWRRIDTPGSDFGFTGNPAVFVEDSAAQRSLIAFCKDFALPVPPAEALRQVLAGLMKKEGRVYGEMSRFEAFRQGTGAGFRFQARSQAEEKGAISTSRIAIITEDGRRYWGVTLNLPIHRSADSETLTEQLFERIYTSMVDGQGRDADAAAFAAAGLSAWGDGLPASVQARVQPGPPLQPVTLVPTDGDGGLCLVRVRGQIHVSALDALPRLETTRGLRRVFAEIYGREPGEKELVALDPSVASSLMLTIDDGKQDGLLRQLRYVPVSEQRALLIELLAEPKQWARAAGIADAALAAARSAAAKAPAGGNGGNGDSATVESALARGKAIAIAQRAAIATAAHEPAYMLRSIASRHVGTYFDLRRVDPGSRLPLTRAQVSVIVLGDQHTLAFSDQTASADARQMVESIATTRSQSGTIDRTSKYRMVLDGDQLTFIRDPLPPGRDYLWSEGIRPQFLPAMAEDDWSLDVLRKEAETWEAVVDRAAGMSRPYPYWIRYAALDKAAGAEAWPKDAAGVITLRPMMAMDALTLWVNAAGRVIAADVPENGGLLAGAVWILHRPATQRDVIAQYPRNAEYIRIWQQEAPTNE